MFSRNTSHSQRWLPIRLLGLALTALVLLLYVFENPLLEVVESKTYDMRMLGLDAKPPTGQISIAAIDEKSLSALGRWPWSRETQGRIVERLNQLGARVIAFDIL
jgi:adenylate cyclase